MTRTEVTDAHVIREQEIGLRLPNGTTVYPPGTWHDHPLASAEDREMIVGLIRAAALRLGYDEDHFLPHYGWATREKISAVVYEPGDELPILATGAAIEFVIDDRIPPGEPFGFDPDLLDRNGEVLPDETLPNEALVD